MPKIVDINGLKYFWEQTSKIINRRINDAMTKGLHFCTSYGVPYSGKAICEHCGRGFFVDSNMYKVGENNV